MVQDEMAPIEYWFRSASNMRREDGEEDGVEGEEEEEREERSGVCAVERTQRSEEGGGSEGTAWEDQERPREDGVKT